MKSEIKTVIGIEIHIELKTKTKIFCSCKNTFGAKPNTHCCPICTGSPGALPSVNADAVEFAVKAGLTLNCTINKTSVFARKNYFYPDLPKGYQISQDSRPLCSNGYILIDTEHSSKKIRNKQIHLEEDAGKLVYNDNGDMLIDYNRCGVPLIEIVSEPDISSSEEAVAYVKKLRALMLWIGISDCRMNEGSLRCDVNISMQNEKGPGVRTEIKNLNSFRDISAALEYEISRRKNDSLGDPAVLPETRGFNTATGKTFVMRSKESSDEYMFFPEPDIPPLILDDKYSESISKSIPELPDSKKAFFENEYLLNPYESEQIVKDREIAEYYEKAAKLTNYKIVLSRLIIGEIFASLSAYEVHIPILPEHIAAVAEMLGNEEISSATAKKLVKELLKKNFDPKKEVEKRCLFQIKDIDKLNEVIDKAVCSNVKSVMAYKGGKKTALTAIIGTVMGLTQGRADPVLTHELLEKRLDQSES